MLTDTHAHLDFPEFAHELPAVLERARAAGVERFVSIGTSLESSRRAVALAETYDCIYAAIGIHPNNAAKVPADYLAHLRALAAHPRVVAIGEIGLDYYRMPGGPTADNPALKATQATVFTQQLQLAAELGLNVVVHEREAWEDTLNFLAPFHGRLRAVFHCFGKSPAHARQLLAHNHLVSFTGIVTFKNAGDAQQSATELPNSTFMLETDCPYLAPVPHRGQRCEPAYTRLTAQKIAQLRGVSLETLAAQSEAVANAFFRFSR